MNPLYAAIVGPILKPLLLKVWETEIYPELQKLESEIGSDDLKLVAQKFIDAVNAIVETEIPKI